MVKFIFYVILCVSSAVICSYLFYLQLSTNGEYIWLVAMLLIASSMSVICLPMCKVLALTNKQEVVDFLEQAFEIQELPHQPHPQLQQVQPMQQPLLLPSHVPKYCWQAEEEDRVPLAPKVDDEKLNGSQELH